MKSNLKPLLPLNAEGRDSMEIICQARKVSLKRALLCTGHFTRRQPFAVVNHNHNHTKHNTLPGTDKIHDNGKFEQLIVTQLFKQFYALSNPKAHSTANKKKLTTDHIISSI
jgi:hypothetical protein